MKIGIVIEVSDRDRLAVAAYYGDRSGRRASRQTMEEFLRGHAEADLENVTNEWERSRDENV